MLKERNGENDLATLMIDKKGLFLIYLGTITDCIRRILAVIRDRNPAQIGKSEGKGAEEINGRSG